MKDLFKFVPQKKTGIKLLSEAQMKSNFSAWESFLEKIEAYRETLNEISLEDMLQADEQFDLMYDMVFSIFGERGGGKTSVAFTLKQMFKKQWNGDIVLPMIMPELIPEGQHILGWILENLESTIIRIEEKIANDSDLIYDADYFTNCKFKNSNPLRKQYDKVRRDCYLLIDKEYISNSFESNINSQIKRGKYSSELIKELSKFWNILIEAQKKTLNSTGKQPLIYIMFDDVDLTPNRTLEIFSTIIKYLSHPNIIVIITAEEKLLYQVIEKYLRSFIYTIENKEEDFYWDNLLKNNDEYYIEKFLENKYVEKLTQSYINKILPPSNQYYIDSYNSCTRKKNFIQVLEFEHNDYKPETVELLLKRLIDKYIKSRNSKKTVENFLYWKTTNGKRGFISSYLNFWGNTSRQISNQYLIVEELLTQLTKLSDKKENIDINQFKEEIYSYIYQFLYRTMLANGLMNSDKNKIKIFLNKIWKYEYDEWELFINYPFIREIFDGNTQNIWELNNEDIINVLIILYFVDNLLVIWDSGKDKQRIDKRQRVYGESILIYILDKLTPEEYSLVKRSENKKEGVNEILYYYEKILEDTSQLTEFNIFSEVQVKDFIRMVFDRKRVYLSDNLNREERISTLYEWSIESPKWFKTIIRLLYLRYENIFRINDDIIYMVSLEQKNLGEDIYTHSKILELENEIVETLSKLYLDSNSEEKVGNKSVDYKNIYKYDDNNEIKTLTEIENNIIKNCNNEKVDIYKMTKKYLEKNKYEKLVQKINKVEKWNKGAKAKNQLIEKMNEIISLIVSNIYNILLYKFEYYSVKNKEAFLKKIETIEEENNNEEISFWCIKIKQEIKIEQRVTIETFQKLIAKIKWYLEEELYKESWQYESKKTRKRRLQEIAAVENLYQFLKNSIYIEIQDENKDNGLKYIALFQLLKGTVNIFLNKYSELMDMDQNNTENAYKDLYKKIKKILKKDNKNTRKWTYVSDLIKNNIYELMLDYIHYVKQRIEGSNIYE